MKSLPRGPALYVALSALAAFWLALANWEHPVLRLAMDYANLVALWFLLLLPWGVAVLAFVRLAGWTRWLMLALAVPSIIVGAIPLLMTSLDLLTTHVGASGSGFTPLHRLPLPHGGALVVYQTNCGAVCDYGVVVRQERALVPGLLLVRDVYNQYHAEDAVVEITAPDRARVESHDVRLLRWVYL
jgi:hypothetical protein